MAMRGLVLITVCLANVLAAQAECCKCDCQQPGLQQSHLYYLPIASTSHLTTSGHESYQGLKNVQLSGDSRYTQALYGPQYQSYSSGQYSGFRGDIENSLDVSSKQGEGLLSLALQKTVQQPSLHYGIQQTSNGLTGYPQQEQELKTPKELSFKYEPLGLSDSAVSSGDLGQKQISKISTQQDNHYIKIEQQVSPQDSSGQEDKGLEQDKDHDHHGKNDYYKFEYGVNDQHTHDIKSHKEEKKGDVVRGEYSLVEDNGNVRTVKYYADWKNGFHAQVHNSKSAALG